MLTDEGRLLGPLVAGLGKMDRMCGLVTVYIAAAFVVSVFVKRLAKEGTEIDRHRVGTGQRLSGAAVSGEQLVSIGIMHGSRDTTSATTTLPEVPDAVPPFAEE